MNYKDREDVWIINREYKPGEKKNKNELPTALLSKIIQYSSNQGDVVCDFFLGSFSTAKASLALGRYTIGFEINKKAFDHHFSEMNEIVFGCDVPSVDTSEKNPFKNQGKPWSKEEIGLLAVRYDVVRRMTGSKRSAISVLSREFGRGYFSLLNIIDRNNFDVRNSSVSRTQTIFDYQEKTTPVFS